MRALVIGLLAGWVLMAPGGGSFDSAAACMAEAKAWEARARDGARWVEAQYRAAPTAFWLEAAHRAAGQVERAKAARCVEVRP